MDIFVLLLIFSAVGGVLSVLVAAVFLLLPETARNRLLPTLVSFATGALLGAAFLALLPHALESPQLGERSAHGVFAVVLGGILLFFVLEKWVLWRHCHAHECETHAPGEGHGRKSASGYLILIGDGIHNFVDGVLIAAAFLTDIHLGIVTSIAVAAHEIPQELGDFAILLHSGFSRARALWYNILSSLTTIVGAVLAYFSLGMAQHLLPYVLAVAAASFIYIAVADLIPDLHKRVERRVMVEQVVLILAGVAVIYGMHSMLH